MGRDTGLADTVAAGMSRLEVTQGGRAGQRFEVLPWQRRFLRGLLREGVQTGALSCARGQGKTTFMAALCVAGLVGPISQPRGEVLAVASSFLQARILFEHCLSFMARRDADRFRVWDTTQQARIVDQETGASLRCVASDPGRAHGLAPSLVVLDEGAQWPTATSERMWAAMSTSLGKVPGGRLVAIGTRPTDPGHWFSRLLETSDPADYVQLHAAKSGESPFSWRQVRRASPSLDAFPDLAVVLKAERERARRDPDALATWQALRLNLGTADTSRPALLSVDEWASCEADELPEREGPSVWGVDLGSGSAMSAVASYWPTSGRLEATATFPRSPDLAARGQNDGVGGLYEAMAKRGELQTCGEKVSDVAELLRMAADLHGQPSAIVADRWRLVELEQSLAAAGITFCPIVSRGMGFRDGSADVRGFRRAVLEGRVHVAPSLLLRSAIAGAVVATDVSGNAKLAKGGEAGRRSRHRDDAVAAAILAVGEGQREASRRAAKPRRSAFLGRV